MGSPVIQGRVKGETEGRFLIPSTPTYLFIFVDCGVLIVDCGVKGGPKVNRPL